MLNLVGSKADRQYIMDQNNVGGLDLVDMLKKYGKVVDYMTEPMVADFYGVDLSAINYHGTNSRAELENYGYRTYKRSEILKMDLPFLEKIPNRGLRLYPIKAVILIGMMLTESEVAAKLRNDIMNKIFNPKDDIEKRLDRLENMMMTMIKSLGDVVEKLATNTKYVEAPKTRAPKTRVPKTRAANFSTLPTVRNIAKPFGITPIEANKILEENGIIKRSDNGKGSILNEEYEDRWGTTIYEDGKEPYVRYFDLGVNSLTKIFSRITNASEQEQLNLF